MVRRERRWLMVGICSGKGGLPGPPGGRGPRVYVGGGPVGVAVESIRGSFTSDIALGEFDIRTWSG